MCTHMKFVDAEKCHALLSVCDFNALLTLNYGPNLIGGGRKEGEINQNKSVFLGRSRRLFYKSLCLNMSINDQLGQCFNFFHLSNYQTSFNYTPFTKIELE